MKSFFSDFIGVLGVAAVSYGAWLILPAAGFITGGLFVIVGTVINSRSPK